MSLTKKQNQKLFSLQIKTCHIFWAFEPLSFSTIAWQLKGLQNGRKIVRRHVLNVWFLNMNL